VVEQLTKVMVQSGAEWVLWTLLLVSVAALAIGIERWLLIRKVRGDFPSHVKELQRLLRAGDVKRAEEVALGYKTVDGNVVAAGLEEAAHGAEAAEEAMAAAMGLERRRLERRLLFLGTVGNNAPFVGLLGTVIGVVGAFDALGKPQEAVTGAIAAAATSLAPGRVMATIAEALVATAVGLLVAIPAVLAFNALTASVNELLNDAQTLGHVLLAHLRGEESGSLLSHSSGRSSGRKRTSSASIGDAE
jgi:biopolymer transport protein ExbB